MSSHILLNITQNPFLFLLQGFYSLLQERDLKFKKSKGNSSVDLHDEGSIAPRSQITIVSVLLVEARSKNVCSNCSIVRIKFSWKLYTRKRGYKKSKFSSLSVLEDHLLFVTGGWGGSEDFLEENHMVFKENGAGSVASERVLRMDYRQGGSLECHKALGGNHVNFIKTWPKSFKLPLPIPAMNKGWLLSS